MNIEITISSDRVVNEEDKKVLKLANTSDRIRYLNDKGFTRTEISKMLGKRYQHVRNVLEETSSDWIGRLEKRINGQSNEIPVLDLS